MDESEDTEGIDIAPGGDSSDLAVDAKKERRKLLDLARDAEKLKGAKDNKLKDATEFIKELVKDGFHPIVFCRFIPTVEYVADELRKKLKGVEIAAVTGKLPPEEREIRVQKLGESKKRVLVCTDCLSEGVNLQDNFDAVIHYDLSWNPTRHEQREGRVDRFGQSRKEVRVISFYGIDNQIDGIVLDVLIRKHKAIRSSLGISVPVPVNTNAVIEAIFEGLLLRGESGLSQVDQMLMFEDLLKPQKEELYKEWDNVSAKEKQSRTVFAQRTIKVDEVKKELDAVRDVIGYDDSVADFMDQAIRTHGGFVKKTNDTYEFDITETPSGMKDLIPSDLKFKARFEMPVSENEIYLNRTHPIVEATASYVMDTTLDVQSESVASRTGVIRTSKVDQRTVLLLLRFRYHIISTDGGMTKPLLAEDSQVIGFRGSPSNPEWLDSESVEKLLNAKPDANISPDATKHHIQRIIDDFQQLNPYLEKVTKKRGDELLDAHLRVRKATRITKDNVKVEPKLPPDILGVYIYLPKPEGNE